MCLVKIGRGTSIIHISTASYYIAGLVSIHCMLEKDCNGNPISTFPPCYAFQMIFTALAPRLIQSISRNVHNKNRALKQLCSSSGAVHLTILTLTMALPPLDFQMFLTQKLLLNCLVKYSLRSQIKRDFWTKGKFYYIWGEKNYI